MRAVQCTGWDGIVGLRVDEVPVPAMQPGCVRIGVHYAGVAFANILMVEGKYQRRPDLPFIPGTDVSGEILEVASDIEGFATGDRVCAFVDGGGWGEQLVHPVETVYPVGDGLPMDAASTLPSSYATALCSLTWRGGLSEGQTLLVLGAGGGVGLAAVDVASALGARVIAVASTPEKRNAALAHGADAAIAPTDFRAQVKSLTDGRGVDVVFDPIGGDIFHDALRCLGIGGRLLTIGYAAGDIPQIGINLLLLKNIGVLGFSWGTYMGWGPDHGREVFAPQVKPQIARLVQMWRDGKIAPRIHEKYPLDRVADAAAEITSRRNVGRVVVHP
jgi:NADPH:quinone reductase